MNYLYDNFLGEFFLMYLKIELSQSQQVWFVRWENKVGLCSQLPPLFAARESKCAFVCDLVLFSNLNHCLANSAIEIFRGRMPTTLSQTG